MSRGVRPPEGGRGPRRKPGSDLGGGHERPAALRPDSGRTPSDDGAPAPPHRPLPAQRVRPWSGMRALRIAVAGIFSAG
jgi:hypothetical protein